MRVEHQEISRSVPSRRLPERRVGSWRAALRRRRGRSQSGPSGRASLTATPRRRRSTALQERNESAEIIREIKAECEHDHESPSRQNVFSQRDVSVAADSASETGIRIVPV